MTPQDVATASAIAAILKDMGNWHFWSIAFAFIFGPECVLFVIAVIQYRRYERIADEQGKRFEAMARMYENNSELVKGYEKLASELADTIRLSTQVQTSLVEYIKHNMFCPVMDGRRKSE